ncbi:hypothetical protein Nepgr_022077 [Nepenthes gracilis]|uniref:Uncharacterized protein n=1 Tax=Nepenthes gracilis TaxID=150966 RepID=A0AAD3XY15_NEPGR|nr:hypothetical protein Nepgr_022077 [Nepenthes gracilis]
MTRQVGFLGELERRRETGDNQSSRLLWKGVRETEGDNEEQEKLHLTQKKEEANRKISFFFPSASCPPPVRGIAHVKVFVKPMESAAYGPESTIMWNVKKIPDISSCTMPSNQSSIRSTPSQRTSFSKPHRLYEVWLGNNDLTFLYLTSS